MTIFDDDAITEWEDRYKPQQNHINIHASWDGCLYETFGVEVDYVREIVRTKGDKHVWTWVNTDKGSSLIAGMAFVNRIGYFVCEVPWTNSFSEYEVETTELCPLCDEVWCDSSCELQDKEDSVGV